MTEVDYKKLGFKCGLEIHQQLDTNKLFCECPSVLREKQPDFEIKRKLKAVAGEMGEKDIAARFEESKEKTFIYEGYNDTTCLVELDEEPPHPMNKDALKIALQVAKILSMKPVDEVEVMRKTVVDGSNTSGFQRTAMIAENGHVDTSEGKVDVSMLALEEDAARKISQEGDTVKYRLDRLGIPLIELRTDPVIISPKQAKETAEKLGLLMRMTGRVKRGIGTIRQDVNVSISGGNRVEIKGFQELRDMPQVIENEVIRQQNLVELNKKLKQRNAKAVRKFEEISKILKESDSNLVKGAIERHDRIYAMNLKGFHTLLKKPIVGERTLAKEFVDYLKHFTGMQGFIHSDELPKYGIIENHVFQIKQLLGCSNEDAFAFVFGKKEDCEKALNILADRSEQLIAGVPKEVRAANDDLTTRFLRPMPGAARMYPETDALPVRITKQLLEEVEEPELPEEKLNRYSQWGLSEDLAKQMLHSEDMPVFERLVKKFNKVNPTTIAMSLLSATDEIRKRYDTVSAFLNDNHFDQTFGLLDKDKIAKEAIIEILAYLSKNPTANAEEVAEKLKLKKISINELKKIIDKIMEENKELAEKKQFGVIMGFVMRKVRGRIDGEIVSNELKKKLDI
jgi:glutamyl-tRNA(Gln) amidotransferase subunit E